MGFMKVLDPSHLNRYDSVYTAISRCINCHGYLGAFPDPKMGGWARLTHNDLTSIFVQMQRRAGNNMIPSLPLNKLLYFTGVVQDNCQKGHAYPPGSSAE
jgi:hypothetical protein